MDKPVEREGAEAHTLINRYTIVQGDTYRVLSTVGNLAFMLMHTDVVRGVGPLHVTTIEKAVEGLIDERKEV